MKTIPCIHAANGFAMSNKAAVIEAYRRENLETNGAPSPLVTDSVVLFLESPQDQGLPDALCETCGEEMDSNDVSVEAFEISGKIVCPECADEIFEENSQFGVGA